MSIAPTDPHRPLYHFLPPAAWLNDPNGLIHWKGHYHLFYQYVPNDPPWEIKHWGHAVSSDLVHWSDLPIALTPTRGGPDQDGCFSGCVFDDDGVPTLIYTGVHRNEQLPCLARGSDDLVLWHKYPGNPIIAVPPPGLDVFAFRDHSIWRDENTWYQLIGSGIKGVGGAVLLYRSLNLIDWEYMHPLYTGNYHHNEPVWTGSMWECPSFFALNDMSVLLVSVYDDTGFRHGAYKEVLHYAVAFVGTYTNFNFIPQTQNIVEYGGYFYAPQTLLDATGRRLLWGWLWEGRNDEAQYAAGWAGVMSLPRVLSLSRENTLILEPAPELELLRDVHWSLADISVPSTSFIQLEEIRGDCLEILVELLSEDEEVTEMGIGVRCALDGTEQTLILYNCLKGLLLIDRRKSSMSEDVERDIREAPLLLTKDEPLVLHVFLDRSVLEVFANHRLCMSSRIYPSRSDSLSIGVVARGGSVTLSALDVWTMKPIWTNSRRS